MSFKMTKINENLIVWETGKTLKNIVDDETNIYNLLKLRSQQPIGEYDIWRGDTLITGDGKLHLLGLCYLATNNLLQLFPLKAGYTRKYKLKLEYTDSKTSGSVYVTIRNMDESYTHDFIFPYTWGDSSDGVRKYAWLDFPQDIMNNYPSHIKIFGTPDFASGGTIRYYRISIVVYDEII